MEIIEGKEWPTGFVYKLNCRIVRRDCLWCIHTLSITCQDINVERSKLFAIKPTYYFKISFKWLVNLLYIFSVINTNPGNIESEVRFPDRGNKLSDQEQLCLHWFNLIYDYNNNFFKVFFKNKIQRHLKQVSWRRYECYKL